MPSANWIATLLLRLYTQLHTMGTSIGNLSTTLLDRLTQLVTTQQQLAQSDIAIFQELAAVNSRLDQLFLILTPPPPVAFIITLTADTPSGLAANHERTQGVFNMAGKVMKATLDFQLLDNGTATATLTPIDTAGLATSLPAGTPV